MTRPAAIGPISIPIQKVRLALAHSQAFQQFVGLDTPAKAEAKAFGPWLPAKVDPDTGLIPVAELDALRPFAQIEIPDGGCGFTRNSESHPTTTTAAQDFDLTATVQVTLERALPDTFHDDIEGAEIAFANAVGEIMRQAFSNSGVAPFGDIVSVSLVSAPYASNRRLNQALGDCMAATIQFILGTGGAGQA